MSGRVGAVISTTGEEHRMKFLETSVENWAKALPREAPLFITVDGSDEEYERVQSLLEKDSTLVSGLIRTATHTNDRQGVAASKNMGIELLMGTGCEHLFLSDDDASPLTHDALGLHINLGIPHSMVCWGAHRLERVEGHRAEWSWPRGVMLYVQRPVIERVGGMIEAFGPGGHEHVEWSRRIFQAGLTPCLYPSPAFYSMNNGRGAYGLWDCVDMPKPGEHMTSWQMRKNRNTSVKRREGDWPRIEALMAAWDGDTSFVPYTAVENGRR